MPELRRRNRRPAAPAAHIAVPEQRLQPGRTLVSCTDPSTGRAFELELMLRDDRLHIRPIYSVPPAAPTPAVTYPIRIAIYNEAWNAALFKEREGAPEVMMDVRWDLRRPPYRTAIQSGSSPRSGARSRPERVYRPSDLEYITCIDEQAVHHGLGLQETTFEERRAAVRRCGVISGELTYFIARLPDLGQPTGAGLPQRFWYHLAYFPNARSQARPLCVADAITHQIASLLYPAYRSPASVRRNAGHLAGRGLLSGQGEASALPIHVWTSSAHD